MKNTVGLGLPEYSFNTTNKALIVGAGLAGCAIANSLAQRGYQCALFDKNTSVAEGASALPAAVVRPATGGNAFYSSWFNSAFELCCNTFSDSLFQRCGALELTGNENSAGFLTAAQASDHAGTQLNSSAVYIKNAGVVVPRDICNHWITHPLIEFHPATAVSSLKKTEYGWQLLADNNTVIEESQLIILATAASQLNVVSEVPLQPVAGQIDRFEYTGPALQCIVNGQGYLVPDTPDAPQSVWCGATHHRNVSGAAVSAADSAANKATAAAIAPQLVTAASPASSFAAARTFTPDRLPVVGAIHDAHRYRADYVDLKHGKSPDSFQAPAFHRGLYLAAGLGSRGATQALLVGELLAGLIAGRMNDNSQSHIKRSEQSKPEGGIGGVASADQLRSFCRELHPARFLIRALRRGR